MLFFLSLSWQREDRHGRKDLALRNLNFKIKIKLIESTDIIGDCLLFDFRKIVFFLKATVSNIMN